MSIWTALGLAKEPAPIEVVAPKPIEYCPACTEVLIKVHQNDGVYCHECGELLSLYVAIVYPVQPAYHRSPALPPINQVCCPRCHRNGMTTPDWEDEDRRKGKETLKKCSWCHALLHAPSGVCVICWENLANNGKCINHECPRYKKPDTARFIPIFEAHVPSPHCGFCAQPFIVFNKGVGNQKIAEIALGDNGYEWVAAHKGCSQCGHAFEKTK